MRRPWARVLMLFLAVLPAVWGNCPCWFADASCCPSDGAARPGATVHGCRCCATRREHAPATAAVHGTGRTPTDDRQRECDGCPILEVRHGATQVPVTVVLPSADAAGLVTPEPAVLLALDAVPALPREVRPPGGGEGGPWGLVGTTLLLI